MFAVQNMEAAKAAADQQLKAAQDESTRLERLRAEADQTADKARKDLAALEVRHHCPHPVTGTAALA